MLKKKAVFSALGRNIGSGPEVTVQTARFYEDLLALLTEHNGNIKSEAFVEDYDKKFKQFSSSTAKPSLTKLPYNDLPHCTVCKGIIDPSNQINQKGPTYTHPFCRDKKSTIEDILSGDQSIELSLLLNQQLASKPQQLSFLDFEQTTSS